MAKSSTNNGSSFVKSEPTKEISPETSEIEEIQVDSVSATIYNIEESVVKLRSRVDGRLEYTGQVTGKLYVWNKAGSVVEVSEVDATYLLEKRRGKRPCCGDSRDGVPIVEMVN